MKITDMLGHKPEVILDYAAGIGLSSLYMAMWYPNAQIIAWLERQDEYPSAQIITGLERQDEAAKSRTTRSDKDGNFIFAADEKPKDGVYGFWAEVMDERGAKSLPTEKITIAVKPSAFLRIG